jgi:sugar-specific transcriptional regulator TrmB
MNIKDKIGEQLHLLGLGHQEAQLYLELLNGPSTHLRLAHATGINRTKVYRLIEDLEKQSLVTRRADDRGTFLIAADPSTLEIAIVAAEEKLKQQKQALHQILPSLHAMQAGNNREFIVNTYEGVEGFKQMLWHELKTEGENVIFGSGTIEDLVPDKNWAEKHRAMTVDAIYTIREILNPNGKKAVFTLNESFMNQYVKRYIGEDILTLTNQISIYNDTVATYHWRNQQKIGFEIISRAYANTMRQMFEHYWQLAQ